MAGGPQAATAFLELLIEQSQGVRVGHVLGCGQGRPGGHSAQLEDPSGVRLARPEADDRVFTRHSITGLFSRARALIDDSCQRLVTVNREVARITKLIHQGMKAQGREKDQVGILQILPANDPTSRDVELD